MCGPFVRCGSGSVLLRGLAVTAQVRQVLVSFFCPVVAAVLVPRCGGPTRGLPRRPPRGSPREASGARGPLEGGPYRGSYRGLLWAPIGAPIGAL